MPQIPGLISVRAGPHGHGSQTRVPAAQSHYLLPSTHLTPAMGKAAGSGSLSLNKSSSFFVSEINFRPLDCERDLHTSAASKLPHVCQGKKGCKCEGNPACGFGRPCVRSLGGPWERGMRLSSAGPSPLPCWLPLSRRLSNPLCQTQAPRKPTAVSVDEALPHLKLPGHNVKGRGRRGDAPKNPGGGSPEFRLY